MRLFSFPPISNPYSQILILGTMPGVESLNKNEYYAHPRNTFWKIMFVLFNQTYSIEYDVKKLLLLNNNVALWDVLKQCTRQGSLDSNILEEVPNDLETFLKEHPQINHLFFNGKKAHDYFLKYNKNTALACTVLPSTSPAHAITFEKKLTQWETIKRFLKNY
jgi:hypoxanthine-DNA glycosylase